jgi:hypothetical protein
METVEEDYTARGKKIDHSQDIVDPQKRKTAHEDEYISGLVPTAPPHRQAEVLKSVQTWRLPPIIAGLTVLVCFFASQKIVFSIINLYIYIYIYIYISQHVTTDSPVSASVTLTVGCFHLEKFKPALPDKRFFFHLQNNVSVIDSFSVGNDDDLLPSPYGNNFRKGFCCYAASGKK